MLCRKSVTSLVRIAIFQLRFRQNGSPYQLAKIADVSGASLFAYEGVFIRLLGYCFLVGYCVQHLLDDLPVSECSFGFWILVLAQYSALSDRQNPIFEINVGPFKPVGFYRSKSRLEEKSNIGQLMRRRSL